jgi:O-antigen ligase
MSANSHWNLRRVTNPELGFGMFWLVFLFVIGMLPWVIPAAMHLRVHTAVFATLVIGTVFGPAFFAINGPIQISLDRIVWAAILGMLAFRLLRGMTSMDRFHRLDGVVVALVGWAFLSCLMFGMMEGDQPRVARWLFYLAIPAAMYFYARISVHSDPQRFAKTIDGLVTLLVVLGTYLSITSVCEMLDLRAFVFPRFINDPKIWEFYGRGRGPLLNPAGNGIVMILGLAACVIRFFSSRRHGKAIYAALALVALAGCQATLTRSVWVGAVLTISLLGIFYVPVKVRVVALAMAIVFAGAMSLGLKEQLLSIKRDKALSAAEAAKSVELRPLLATVAWEMFKDRPLAGHGYGGYRKAAEPYHAIRSYGIPLENVRPYVQHNVFLSLLVDLGLIGLSLHLLLVMSMAFIAWQLARNHDDGTPHRQIGMLMIGMLAGYFTNGMFHDVSVIEMVHCYLFVLAGLTVTVWANSTCLVLASAPNQVAPMGQAVANAYHRDAVDRRHAPVSPAHASSVLQ